MIQRIKSENNRNERDHLILFGWSLRLRAMGALSQVKVLNMPR